MNQIMELPDMMQAEHTTLYYREGNSDKVYQANIESRGEAFVVNFAYGRRGSTMNTGTKTSQPVDYETAWQIYSKLVNEKKAKGYTEGEAGTPYQNSPKQASGLLPQLLNPIDEAEVARLTSDPNYVMQQKHDGRRMILRKQNGTIEAINRKGLVVGLPVTLIHAAKLIPRDFFYYGWGMRW